MSWVSAVLTGFVPAPSLIRLGDRPVIASVNTVVSTTVSTSGAITSAALGIPTSASSLGAETPASSASLSRVSAFCGSEPLVVVLVFTVLISGSVPMEREDSVTFGRSLDGRGIHLTIVFFNEEFLQVVIGVLQLIGE